MDHINTLIKPSQITQRSQQSDEQLSNGLQTERVMARLWQVMAETYGHKWTSGYGPIPTNSWVRHLADVTPDRIKHGLNELAKSGDPWPPSAPEFRALCLDAADDGAWERIAHKPHQHLALPDIGRQERSRKAGQETLAQLRGLFV